MNVRGFLRRANVAGMPTIVVPDDIPLEVAEDQQFVDQVKQSKVLTRLVFKEWYPPSKLEEIVSEIDSLEQLEVDSVIFNQSTAKALDGIPNLKLLKGFRLNHLPEFLGFARKNPQVVFESEIPDITRKSQHLIKQLDLETLEDMTASYPYGAKLCASEVAFLNKLTDSTFNDLLKCPKVPQLKSEDLWTPKPLHFLQDQVLLPWFMQIQFRNLGLPYESSMLLEITGIESEIRENIENLKSEIQRNELSYRRKPEGYLTEYIKHLKRMIGEAQNRLRPQNGQQLITQRDITRANQLLKRQLAALPDDFAEETVESVETVEDDFAEETEETVEDHFADTVTEKFNALLDLLPNTSELEIVKIIANEYDLPSEEIGAILVF